MTTTYFDTSALVKLYVGETNSHTTREILNESSRICTSRVAYAEACAAFSRIQRENRISMDELDRITRFFSNQWSQYLVKDVDENITQQAGRLAREYSLRGFDSLHLSTALFFRNKIEEEIQFLAFDNQLTKAATGTGLDVRP